MFWDVELVFPCAPPHSATDVFGHLEHILKFLPTSYESVIDCAGGSWAVISLWEQQLGIGHGRAGLAFAQHRLTPCLVAFLAGFLPACTALGPSYSDTGTEGKRAPPREAARSRLDKQVAQPWAGVTDPISR